jgi:hypothetical protein
LSSENTTHPCAGARGSSLIKTDFEKWFLDNIFKLRIDNLVIRKTMKVQSLQDAIAMSSSEISSLQESKK